MSVGGRGSVTVAGGGYMSVGGRGLGVRGCVDDGLDSMTRTVDVEYVEVDDLVTSV